MNPQTHRLIFNKSRGCLIAVGENARSNAGSGCSGARRGKRQQSAIRAGDGVFDVDVAGNTTLTGGQITSTQAAIDQNKNRFETGGSLTTTDLQNSASFEAQSVSVGVDTSSGMTSGGLGQDGGSASSTTTAGISGVAGNAEARTGDQETGLVAIFDKDKVKQEVAAQVAITSEFGKNATQAWGEFSNKRFEEAVVKGDEESAKCWAPDGACRAGGHAVVGGLTGGVEGAVGAEGSSLTAPHVQAFFIEQGVPAPAAAALTQLSALGAGTAIGGSAGGAAAFNEASNNAVLAIPLLVEGLIAGGAVAARTCLNSPACVNALRLAGTATVAKVASMLSPDELAQIPGFAQANPMPPVGPTITPADAQRVYGAPPFENPKELRAWLGQALQGVPSDEADKWAKDLIRTLPAADQRNYTDLIVQQVHHICTDKNCVSPNSGGPWTPEFSKLFDRAGVSMQDELNKVWVTGHQGPHPEAYHREVFDRLNEAGSGKSGDEYTRGFRQELEKIKSEIGTPGSRLNNLVTKK